MACGACWQALAIERCLPCRFGQAAGVYNALALRLSGPGDSGVTLEERLQAFQDALMQVRQQGLGECEDAMLAYKSTSSTSAWLHLPQSYMLCSELPSVHA